MSNDEKPAAEPIQPIWCLVATVIEERSFGPGGTEKRYGTKLFSGGTKIYVLPFYRGESVEVYGLHRHSRKFIRAYMKHEHLTHWRAQLIYSPTLIQRLTGFWGFQGAFFKEANSPEQQIELFLADLHADIERRQKFKRTNKNAGNDEAIAI